VTALYFARLVFLAALLAVTALLVALAAREKK
jgi:hypothetical protein